MLKFFRNIRRTLLADNKTGKYFKYAIGEVILVMVGILLALQVNNWNEEKKTTLLEEKVLRELRETLKENVKLLNNACGHIISVSLTQSLHTAYHRSLSIE